MRYLIRITAALLMACSGAGAAAAAEASVSLHVRSGPSTSYQVVDTLYAGEHVNVQSCSGGWCQITHSGHDGWVSAGYLAGRNAKGPLHAAPPSPQTTRSHVSLSFSVPGFGFRFGNGGRFEHRPGHHGGRVCFYRDFNYSGPHFCAYPGQHRARLGRRFNDQISSIRITGDAQVQVCENFDHKGRCAVLDKSQKALRGRNNDIISSYRVRQRFGHVGRGK